MPIEEYPHLRIDDFRRSASMPEPALCILTHMHEDHTLGLSRKSYHGPVVYCTATTRALVLNYRSHNGRGWLKYSHLRKEVGGKEILQVLELDRAYVLPYCDSTLQVTLIDSNHCPGGAMVLLQPPADKPGRPVLFTGDVRCERWYLDALSHNPALLPFLRTFGSGEELNLYVDDTFMTHINPLKSYQENRNGIQALLALLDTYPANLKFCLAERATGHEEVLIAVAKHFRTRIHMDAYTYGLYQLASATSPLAARLLELSFTGPDAKSDARLHFCHKHNGCSVREPYAPTVYFRPCNQPGIEAIWRQNAQIDVAVLPLGTLDVSTDNPAIVHGPRQRYYFDEVSKRYYPLFPWFYFSRHASYPELFRLKNLFRASIVRSLHGVPLALLCMPEQLNAADLPLIAASEHVYDKDVVPTPAVNVEEASTKQTHVDVDAHSSSATSRLKTMVEITSTLRDGEDHNLEGVEADKSRRAACLGSKEELNVHKKQIPGQPRANRRKRRRADNDSWTSNTEEENERHEALGFLNRQSIRHNAKRQWRESFRVNVLSNGYEALDGPCRPSSSTQRSDVDPSTDSMFPCASDSDNDPGRGPMLGGKTTDKAGEVLGKTISGDSCSLSQTPTQTSKQEEASSLPSPPSTPLLEVVGDDGGLVAGSHRDLCSRGLDLPIPKELDCLASAKSNYSHTGHINELFPEYCSTCLGHEETRSEGSVIDETPTTEAIISVLEEEIRRDPSCWFNFEFESFTS